MLRILGLTVFKSVYLGNLFKKFIVNMLMTGKNKVNGQVLRKFKFNEDVIIVSEKIVMPNKCQNINHIGKSKAIHMASSGYFATQNFKNQNSQLVDFINV